MEVPLAELMGNCRMSKFTCSLKVKPEDQEQLVTATNLKALPLWLGTAVLG